MTCNNIHFVRFRHWGKNTGSGSIFSSANDMAKWMLMLLNDGKDSNGGRVVTEGVLGEVFKPSNVVPPSSYAANYRRPVVPESFTGDEYGLAWKLGYYRGDISLAFLFSLGKYSGMYRLVVCKVRIASETKSLIEWKRAVAFDIFTILLLFVPGKTSIDLFCP